LFPARVDQARVGRCPGRRGHHADDAVLAVEDHLAIARQVARGERGNADAEVHVGAVGQVRCDEPRHAVAIERAERFGHCACSRRTTRCTKMPGSCTPSGSIAPSGTIDSTWATATREAIATTGLKLRSALLNTRLPQRSPCSALTRPKSPWIGCSST